MRKNRLFAKLSGSITVEGKLPSTALESDIDLATMDVVSSASGLSITPDIGELAFVEETNKLYLWNDSAWYRIPLTPQ